MHGIPLTVMADSMLFDSVAMQSFALSWGFTIETSSPHHAKFSGMADRLPQTVRHFLKDARALTKMPTPLCWLIVKRQWLAASSVKQRCFSIGAYGVACSLPAAL